MKKIDLNALKSIFGDKLPSKAEFLANNHGHGVTMRDIVKHVGDSRVKHNFTKVWTLFVAEYEDFVKESAPVVTEKITPKVEKPVVDEDVDKDED